MTTKHDCSGKIWGAYRDVSGRVYKCSRNATIKRNGQWYCWQHDPERVAGDKEKRRVADKAKMDRYTARWETRALNAKLAALVTPGLAALLERLSEILPTWGDGAVHRADLDEASTTAARIREALGLEVNDAS